MSAASKRRRRRRRPSPPPRTARLIRAAVNLRRAAFDAEEDAFWADLTALPSPDDEPN
jgi:hypothetical protein